MINKFSNYKIALNGKFCNIGKLEPCDSNLIKIRNTITLNERNKDNEISKNIIKIIY